MRNIFKYLRQYHLTEPIDVDRLIVSAFLQINNLKLKYNTFLKGYLINKTTNEQEYLNLQEFVIVVKSEINTFDFEKLIELFEFVISPADRVVNGAVYTPSYIREYIVKNTLSFRTEIKDVFKVADIACGCGGFLFNAAIELKRITKKTYAAIFREHIFGLDIQRYAITRTKLLLSLLALSSGEDEKIYIFNLETGDALDFKWGFGFDVILGNPPYVCARKLDRETREKLKKMEVCKSGSSDLYIPFFQIAIENLASNGIIGFITMNTFFKSLNGRDLRAFFQKKSLAFSIIDFGGEQIFRSKNTYTCICFIENREEDWILYSSTESLNLYKNQNRKENLKNAIQILFTKKNIIKQ